MKIILAFIVFSVGFNGYSQARMGGSQIRHVGFINTLPRQTYNPPEEGWHLQLEQTNKQAATYVQSSIPLTMTKPTNQIIFAIVYSSSGTPLMTNAELRFALGTNVLFKSGDDYKSFPAISLNSNTFKNLNFTPQTLQSKFDENVKAHQNYAADVQKYKDESKAEIDREAYLRKQREDAAARAFYGQP